MLYNLFNTSSDNFFLIAGPCVIENDTIPFEIAEKLYAITKKLQIPFIYKASYRKANRSKIDSFSGIGDEKALDILFKIKQKYNIPVLTDIHESSEAKKVMDFVDVIQIPAFLSRQTELLTAAAKTNKVINIKKAQYASPNSMKFAIEKVNNQNNTKVTITERGTTFGYNNLVVDFTSIPIMKEFNVPVIVDCTHSLQMPNQSSGITGGRPEMIGTIANAAIAVGSDGIFLETHPDPKSAKSDGANMLDLNFVEELLEKLVRIRKAL